MIFGTVLTVAVTAALLVISVIVLANNPKSKVNRLLVLFLFVDAAWLISVDLLHTSLGDEVYFARFIFVLGVLLAVTLNTFISALTDIKWKRILRFYYLSALVVAALTMSDMIIVSVERSSNALISLPYPVYGSLIGVYGLVIFLGLVLAVWRLIRQVRSQTGYRKQQARITLLALTSFAVIAIMTNLLVPSVIGDSSPSRLAPIGSLLLASLIAYAIIKHRLFDIRLVIARAIAYGLVILTLGLVYGVTVFQFVDQFFPGTQTTTLQQAIYVLLAVFLAFTFQPMKRFFNKWTDKIFYQDHYETEDILNRLGKVFISKSNSFELLDDSLNIIVDALKVGSGRLAVLKEGEVYTTAEVGDVNEVAIDSRDLKGFDRRISILDEVENTNKQEKLTKLQAYAVVQLMVHDELTGYLLLGPKRSGTIYTRQDINFLEILSQELAVAIQNAKSYEEIQAFSETLKKEVEEATAKLRETNQRLVKLDEAKDEFISMASHQLRTPLTTIKGYLSMLMEGDAGKIPKKQQEFIDMAYTSSQRMVHLISDMLNVSRISTGKLTIDKDRFDLADVVSSEVNQLQRQAEAHEVDLVLHPPKQKNIEVELDEGKLRQVIMNFIDNAIYYSPKGKVEVHLEEKDGFVEFKVKDNGIGISEETKKQLFKKFFRGDNARSIRPDGTGLGLYMAKQVVESQDGEIIFESKEGKGSTFGFRFKLEDQPVDQPADKQG